MAGMLVDRSDRLKSQSSSERGAQHVGFSTRARSHVADSADRQRARAKRPRPLGQTSSMASARESVCPETEIRLVEKIMGLEAKDKAWRTTLWQLTILAEGGVTRTFADFLHDWDLVGQAKEHGFVATTPSGARVCTAMQWLTSTGIMARTESQDLASFNSFQHTSKSSP
jgi:hypothetical protein